MTDRELRKLNRTDLLELLLEQLKENERLQAQLSAARNQLAERKSVIDKAGSIAEAALQLNGVFEAAQAACAQYIADVEQLSDRQAQICAQMEQQTREKCDQMLAEARTQSQAYWDDVCRRVQELTSSYAELRTILQQMPSGGVRG